VQWSGALASTTHVAASEISPGALSPCFLIPPGLACAWLLLYPQHSLLSSRLAAPRAQPFDQVHREVSVAQLSDEVGGNRLPRAGSWAPDPVVVTTILHKGGVTFVGHHRA
jgi:hypothetical protein